MTALSTEKELLTQLRRSDPGALGELYQRYRLPVYRYVLSLVKIPEFTEDIVHEVFIKIWNARHKLEVRSSLESYLLRIGHNVATDALLKISRDRELRGRLLHHYDHFSTEDISEESLRRYDELVAEALALLSPQQRRIYELCKKEERSYAEVAELLGIARNTVKEQMVRSIAKLRAFVQENGKLGLLLVLMEKFL